MLFRSLREEGPGAQIPCMLKEAQHPTLGASTPQEGERAGLRQKLVPRARDPEPQSSSPSLLDGAPPGDRPCSSGSPGDRTRHPCGVAAGPDHHPTPRLSSSGTAQWDPPPPSSFAPGWPLPQAPCTLTLSVHPVPLPLGHVSPWDVNPIVGMCPSLGQGSSARGTISPSSAPPSPNCAHGKP